mmetsp:Transcript_149/g.514  ORF Transcript_149/g.514 Transcript_149/m.514 type:complete len:243 (+) Transcript_149:1102-1830(+)
MYTRIPCSRAGPLSRSSTRAALSLSLSLSRSLVTRALVTSCVRVPGRCVRQQGRRWGAAGGQSPGAACWRGGERRGRRGGSGLPRGGRGGRCGRAAPQRVRGGPCCGCRCAPPGGPPARAVPAPALAPAAASGGRRPCGTGGGKGRAESTAPERAAAPARGWRRGAAPARRPARAAAACAPGRRGMRQTGCRGRRAAPRARQAPAPAARARAPPPASAAAAPGAPALPWRRGRRRRPPHAGQ